MYKNSFAPKKAKVVASSGRVMAFVFWDQYSILIIDYLWKGCLFNGEYYANLLSRLQRKIQSKRSGMLKKGVRFHQDNALTHKSLVAMLAIRDCELVDYHSYSSELASLNNYFFSNLKKHLGGKRYQSDDDVISAVEDYLEGQEESFFKIGIQMNRVVNRAGFFASGPAGFGLNFHERFGLISDLIQCLQTKSLKTKLFCYFIFTLFRLI